MAAEAREPDQLTVNKLTHFVGLAFARHLFWTPTQGSALGHGNKEIYLRHRDDQRIECKTLDKGRYM